MIIERYLFDGLRKDRFTIGLLLKSWIVSGRSRKRGTITTGTKGIRRHHISTGRLLSMGTIPFLRSPRIAKSWIYCCNRPIVT
jgi:hypothetical protein